MCVGCLTAEPKAAWAKFCGDENFPEGKAGYTSRSNTQLPRGFLAGKVDDVSRSPNFLQTGEKLPNQTFVFPRGIGSTATVSRYKSLSGFLLPRGPSTCTPGAQRITTNFTPK